MLQLKYGYDFPPTSGSFAEYQAYLHFSPYEFKREYGYIQGQVIILIKNDMSFNTEEFRQQFLTELIEYASRG